ncbi:MAG: hypothetical protein HYU58_10875 [Proteobacteria bacterium]|nr:hypothetical protein [Pseudomonadota bacterium]
MTSRLLWILGSLLAFVCGYALLWIASSASLAMTACNNEFSLFHEDFRCRQPDLAAYWQ